MKRCPKCSRSFPDENQKFCTIDGGLLVTADKPFDPNATIQGPPRRPIPVEPPAGKPVSPVSNELPDFDETVAASAPTVVFPKQTGPTGSATAPDLPPSPGPPPPQPQSAPLPQAQAAPLPRPQSAPLPRPQSAPLPPVSGAPLKKKSKLPLILGVLAILFVLGIGAVVAAFFVVIKPRLDQMNSERPIVVRSSQPENANNNVNDNANTNSEEAKPEGEKTESEFVAPPNTTKFTNSQANLDEKLAEHYLDFSFYYPDSWVVDPKAGTAASGNFAKVERRLPPDFTQENFAVRWYESKGTFASDLPNYPTQVEEFSASLDKAFPEYHKVSEGPTKINSLDAYEFRWVAASKGTVKGDLQLWGRVVFVPTGVEGNKTGAILTMFTTSLAPELSGVEDVGEKGQTPVILESFRFVKGR
jgi:flagellar basal body-associated protein FliL